jgi:hypothetical protein
MQDFTLPFACAKRKIYFFQGMINTGFIEKPADSSFGVKLVSSPD